MAVLYVRSVFHGHNCWGFHSGNIADKPLACPGVTLGPGGLTYLAERGCAALMGRMSPVFLPKNP